MISYYAVIPADVRYDTNLTANAKLLYAEITALANHNGYCWATNEYFANLYQLSERTISRLISSLEKEGYLNVEIDKSQGNKRKIFLNLSSKKAIDKNDNSYGQNCPPPMDKNGVSIYVNNKNINIKDNKENNIKEILTFDFLKAEVIDDFIKFRKEVGKKITSISAQRLKNKIIIFHGKGLNVEELLYNAIDRGWLTIFEPSQKFNYKSKVSKNEDILDKVIQKFAQNIEFQDDIIEIELKKD